MFDLFRVPWQRLDIADVRSFLSEAQDDEGVTWEAKADDDDVRKRPEGEEPGELHARTIQKGVSALANQIGGYLILGARWDRAARKWLLPGFVPPEPEAKTWLSNVLDNLRPVPRHDVRAWNLRDDRWAAVVAVEPVDEPPCMTPLGHVYERVSGKSVRVTDPVLLDRLMRRGRERRAEAESFALGAAALALDLPGWEPPWSVRIAVAMAPVGRETTDISSRLFVPSFKEQLTEGLWRFMPEHPTDRDHIQRQDALGLAGHFSSAVSNRYGNPAAAAWSSWLIVGLWTGAVVASATFSALGVEDLSSFDGVVMPGWREVAPLVERLGGYGPAHLALVVRTAPERKIHELIDGAAVAPEAQPEPPPSTSLFGRLPRGTDTVLGRSVGVGEPSSDVLAGMQRELQRAAGMVVLEPE